MVPRFTLTVSGVRAAVTAALMAKLRNLQGSVFIDVIAGGTRGGEKNAMIAKVQAGLDRNPWYVSAEWLDLIRARIRSAVQQEYGATEDDLRDVGEILKRAVLSNLEAQQNKRESGFRDLSEGYAKQKQRAVGFVKPILVRTGDLRGGMSSRVSRG